MAEMLILRARIAFANGIFTASAAEEGGKKKFNAKFILEPDHKQIDKIRALEDEVAKDKWGKDAEKIMKRIRATADKMFLRDGDTQRADGFEGNLYFSANNDKRPTVFNKDRSSIAEEDGIIYSGCYVNVKVNLWAQDNQYGQRINGELLGVQFAGDGDSFSAGAPPAAADDFPDMEDGADDADPFG
jgi:hypothetical protein